MLWRVFRWKRITRNPEKSVTFSSYFRFSVWFFQYLAAIQVLRGKIFDKLENPQNACQAYLKALELDPYSYDALEQLADRRAMSNEERDRFLLDISRATGEAENIVGALYQNQLCPDDCPSNYRDWESSRFSKNPDFLLVKANRLWVSSSFLNFEILKIVRFFLV